MTDHLRPLATEDDETFESYDDYGADVTDERVYHEPLGEPCALCGKEGRLHRQKRGSGKGRAERKYWVGIDGEGLGRNPHRYVMMAWSDETGRKQDIIKDGNGLSTIDCLEFLLSLPCDGRIAGYYLSYDWTMILRDLPNKRIYQLLRPELRYRGRDEGHNFTPIRWKHYRIDHVGKMWRVSTNSKSVTIWDVGNFFQSTFVRALEKWSITDKKTIKAIAAMKERRSRFTKHDFEEMGRYCLDECRLLAQLIRTLNDAHTEAGLKLKTWHGPGSTANVALGIMGIAEKRGKIPKDMLLPVRRAFFGGRFEQRLCAEVKGPVYGYDIVSAYPYQAFKLPCLEHGVWEHVSSQSELRDARHALIEFSVDKLGCVPWAPLPIRLANGCIVFPKDGARGWVWRDEFIMAQNVFRRGIVWHQAWALRSDCICQPFERVLDWFRERERLGKDAKGHTFRLGLNSIYGKLAQTCGQPRFRSLVWAGMITSGCRAQLLELMAQGLEDIYAVATDGIYSKKPFRTTAKLANDRLGSWEEKLLDDTVFVRPGIYWSSNKLVRARGIGNNQLEKHKIQILEAIRKGEKTVSIKDPRCEEEHEANCNCAQAFGSAKNCIYKTQGGRILRSTRYGEWMPLTVELSLEPMPKRAPGWECWELDGVESMPYKGVA